MPRRRGLVNPASRPALGPAPSPASAQSSSRGDVGRGHGVRAFAVVALACAALMGVSAPAQAQTDVLSATLTVKDLGTSIVGCTQDVAAGRCSDFLSEDEFTYGSTDYTITALFLRPNGLLEITFDPALRTDATTLTLDVAGTAFDFEDATTKRARARIWSSSGLSWSVDDPVVVKLVEPAPTVPAAPVLTATANGETQIDLSWTVPDNGGRALDKYSIDVSADGGTTWGPQADVGRTITTYSHTGLTAGTTRHYRVRAVNTIGEGAWSNIDSATTGTVNTPATGNPFIIGMPTPQVGQSLSASVGNINDADGTTNVVVSYQWIRVDGATETDITGATTNTYTPVAGDVGKQLKVRASFTDDLGNPESRTSPATLAVQAATAATAPGVPRTLAAAPGDGEVVLTWTVPASTGGEAITRYEYRSKATSSLPFVSSDSWTGVGTARTATVGSLTNGTPYSFEVRAVNTVGAGTAATASATPTATARGTQPTLILDVDRTRFGEAAGSARICVVPSAPSSQRITVQVATADGTATAPGDYVSYSSTVALQPQQQRACFTVTLVDDAEVEGDETFTVTLSNPVNATLGTPAVATFTIVDDDGGANVAPTFTEGTSTTRSVAENTASGQNIGAPVAATDADTGDTLEYTLGGTDFKSFRIHLNTGQLLTQAALDFETKSSYAVSVSVSDGNGGTDNIDVTISVTDVNEDGNGGGRPTTSAPRAPRNLTAVGGDGEVALTWRAPSSDGGAAITDYEYRIDGTDPWISTGSTSTTHTVTGLVNGTEYTFEVRAVNRKGPGRVVEVTVQLNSPPAFTRPAWSFELPENRDGSGQPVELGAVTAEDPDGDALTYGLVSGDRERFAVGARDGVLTYTGPGEDFESEPQSYTLAVQAHDDKGLATTAAVVVTVTDVNESPAAVDDEAETEEDREVVIAVLANDTDPDGDALEVEAVSAAAHGATRITAEGEVAYTPEPDYHGADGFTYVVSDGAGETATGTVTVTVTPVNDAPAAVDDEAHTEEDREVVIAVLANDTDAEGDALHVETVSAAAHGATRITADGGVAYTPEPDYHGVDGFTYVVSDGAGETATGTVTVTVTAANDAPVAVGVIPDQVVEEGGGAAAVDVTPFFDDIDGDALTFRAVSSDAAVAAVTVSGAVLTVTPVAAGAATVTVTATDPGGLTVTQTFGVGVGDRLVRAMFEGTLAAMARGHLASARMTLGRRVAAGADEPSRLTVMGRAVPLGTAAVRAEAEQLAANWLLGLASRADGSREAAAAPGDRSGAPALGLSSLRGSLGVAGVGSEDPMRGTNFLLAWGADAQTASPSRRWTLWGQGDIQDFRGEPTGASGYEGDVRTGYLGLDVRLTDRWLAGVALARSSGAGDWNTGSASGRLTTTLTAIHPYVRWSNGATSVWTMVGGGRGTADNARAAGRSLGLGLGLVEVRRALGALGGGVEVGLRGDAAWARLSTEEGTGTLDALRVNVNQLRVGVDVARPIRVGNGLELAPFGEVHARRDGGAGQVGNGLELVGGLRVAGGIVRLDAQGRLLTLHSADGYRERGAGVTLSVGQGAERTGLTLSMSPRWGARASSADALWQDHVYRDVRATGGEERALDGRVAYGVGMGRGRLLTPFAVYGQSQYGRRLQVGTRVGALGGMSGEPLRIEVSGERHTRPGSPAEHRMSLAGVITFGRP